MWVRTQEGDLVNLDQVEWIVVEVYDESAEEEAAEEDYDEEEEGEEEPAEGQEAESYELRAYQVGWNADAEDSSSFYTLSSSPSRATVEQHLQMVVDALTAGNAVLMLPQAAEGWSS